MPNVGDTLEGPTQTLRIDRLEPDVLEMESHWAGGGDLPPAHLHPSQVERFTVLEGRLRTVIAGDERVYETGEEFEVPVGVAHQMTATDGPARARWEVRPALRTAEAMERLFTGQFDGFLEEFADEIRLA
jgi:hypothetical protein